jgi:VanZ family protein
LLHGLAFGSLAVTLLWGRQQGLPGRPVTASGAAFAIAVASGYGIVDELHQSFIPGRDAAVHDWIADSAGALAAVLLVAVMFAALQGVWENPAHSSAPAPFRDRE